MNIKQLNALMIKKDTNNRLHRGMRCYKEGTVVDVKSIIEKEYGSLDIYGKVMSESDISIYETNISFDLKKGDLVYTECSCIDFKNNSDFNSTYICKHIGATFYKFIQLLEYKLNNQDKEQDNFDKEKQENIDYSELLLRELSILNNSAKERAHIQINLTAKNYSRGERFYEADFKVGSKKLYVVKSVYDFIMSRKHKKKLEFGKEFEYNPDIHYFSEEDERILNFIEEYVELNRPLQSEYSVHKVINNIFGKGKTILISQSALKRFLSNLNNNSSINYTDGNKTRLLEIKKENLPIKFNINKCNDDIDIECQDNIPEPMTDKGDIYIYEEKIYIPLENQVRYYKIVNKILRKEKLIKFKGDKKQEVFNKVIPILEVISNDVNIDESLENSIIKEEATFEIYFDRDKSRTFANVKVLYGNISFNLLKGPENDEYIIRDFNKENQIEKLLNEINFYRDKEVFNFSGDDEKLYELLTNELIELKKEATIFYSDRFKERRIYGSNSINASITEGKGNYLEFNFDIDNVNEDELKKIINAFKENRKFFKLKDESFIDLQDKEMVNFLNLVDNLSEDSKINTNSLKVHKSKSIFLNESINKTGISFIKGKDIVEHIYNKFNDIEKVNYSIPEELNADLRDYQINGFKWFKTLSYYEFGGILADEMGLGKTLQTIAFILSEKGKKSIIITPTSLIYNWKNEFEKFAPSLKIKIIHGNKEDRSFTLDEITKYDVLLTTYGTLRNDYELYKDVNFDYCIIDEGQNIKNPLSQSSEAVKDIKAKVKFALTGTPIENNLLELWSLFDYIMPGYLYNRNKFQDKFMKRGKNTEDLKRLIRPFILRRLKSEVMSELPDKIEKRFYTEMTEEQKKVYKAYVDDVKVKMKDKDLTKDKITIFSYLTKLRQLTLDPSIVLNGYKGGSGKIDITVELIQEYIKEGHKILLFSQFTSVLDRIKEVLESEGINYFYLDGATKASERVYLVNEFNNSNDSKVFLISLKAGGTGLNLTSADIVIHFDPWWNPAIEDQATDRAHRFGQKNIVEVIKLIAKGSIEEKIIKLQESKKEIISEIMSGNYANGGFLGSLSSDEIKELFN